MEILELEMEILEQKNKITTTKITRGTQQQREQRKEPVNLKIDQQNNREKKILKKNVTETQTCYTTIKSLMFKSLESQKEKCEAEKILEEIIAQTSQVR